MTQARVAEQGAGSHLLALLDEQAGLCRRLDELGARQEECIEMSDTDGLLRVLGERKSLVDRIGAVSAELEPLRTPAKRDAIMATLPEPQRQRVRTLVDDLKTLAERIQRRDEAGRGALEERRGRIAEEIAGITKARGAVAAYGRSASGRQWTPGSRIGRDEPVTTIEHEQLSAVTPTMPPSALSERDLVELLGAFNEATLRLQTAHDALHREVARLKGELRDANEQLERSRRLAALGEMAAGISHEVRNPLGCIRLYAGMLEEDLADRPACRETAKKIIGAVRGLDAVVCDVLTFAREMTVREERVEAGEMLARAADEAVPGTGDAGGVRVRIVSRGAELSCDPALLHRALVNVVRNAAEAAAENGVRGEVTLEARAEIDAEGRGWSVLSVSDTGPGIPTRVMERMFNPFFTTRTTGTGLGLSIVHRIVDAHGGRVAVRNRVEGGAVVEMWIPTERSISHGRDARDQQQRAMVQGVRA